MHSSASSSVRPGPWFSLWVVAFLSLLGQLYICQFFTFGVMVPMSIDVNPSNLWKMAYHFPPTGTFLVLNWLGTANLPQPLNPLSWVAGHWSIWWFFTFYTPVISTLALLTMVAFLRELQLPRPAALFGGVIYAWQGDLLCFVFPGHFGYITMWPFFALAAWGALRANRTRYWAYAVISGTCCGIMVGLLTNADRGGIACLFIAVLFLAPLLQRPPSGDTRDYLVNLRLFALCVITAFLIALAPLLSLFQSNITGVKLGGSIPRDQSYKLVTQYSLGPAETLTYLVPGFFGWYSNSSEGPYWGWIGEWPDWKKTQEGDRNSNLAISTTGTIATTLSLIGAFLLLPGALGRWLGPSRMSPEQRFYGQLVFIVGFITLILAWGWHTPFYRSFFELPLMDKWRNPLKWLEVTDFALITLSAFGVQHLLASLESDAPETPVIRRRLIWFSNILVLLLGLGFLASYYVAIVLRKVLANEGFEAGSVANAMSLLHISLLWAVVLTALFGLLLRAIWRPDWLRGFKMENPLLQRGWQKMLQPESLPMTLAVVLAMLSVAQLNWVTHGFIRGAPLDALMSSNPLLDQLKTKGDRVRVSVATEDPLLNLMLLNQFTADRISSIDISAASRIPDDINTFLHSFDNNQARLWFLSGVKSVVVPQQLLPDLRRNPDIVDNIAFADGYTLMPPSEPNLPTHALLTMKEYLTKATLVPSAEFFSSDAKLLEQLKDPAWNARLSVLLLSAPTVQPKATPTPSISRPGMNHVDLQTYTPTDIDLETQTDAPGYFLLINDQYDSDWQVQVNGQDAPLLRADYIMRAVLLPPGTARVTMHYVAHYHLGKMKLSAEAMNNLSDGSMLAAWLIAGFAIWRRRSQDGATKL